MDINNLISFISSNTIEDSLYWNFNHISGNKKFEVFWKKKNNRPMWMIYDENKNIVESCLDSELIDVLNSLGIDLHDVERGLNETIFMQIAFAKSVLDDANELYGEKAVESVIEDYEQFKNDLMKVIQKVKMKKTITLV